MSESLPITQAPRRRQDNSWYSNTSASINTTITTTVAQASQINSSSESCKNTPNIGRKHEHYFQHNLMFKSGSHSAHNSPLPHRRLDKLEGVIRDKPSPLCGRRHLESDDFSSSSVELSPIFPRKNNNHSSCCTTNKCSCSSENHTFGTGFIASHCSANNRAFNKNTSDQLTPNSIRRNTECSCVLKSPEINNTDAGTNCNNIEKPRRRVESDCSNCMRRNLIDHVSKQHQNYPGSNATTPKTKRKDLFFATSSPAKSILGEPGVFSSPVHQSHHNRTSLDVHSMGTNNFAGIGSSSGGMYGSPSKSILGEPGVFASPARSICAPSPSPCDDKHQNNYNEDDDGIPDQPQPDQTVVSGWLKFRDNKRWKIRWGVVTKLSPAADCLHLQLYRDSKDRYKHGQTKASLSLEHFLGVESGFTLDKESNTIAIICQDVIVVLAFDTRERLMQWQVKIGNHLGDDIQYLVLVSSAPSKSKMQNGPSRMHIQDNRFCLTTGVPPKLAGLWDIGYLRRYGVVDNRFCFEGGSRCGKGEGLYVFVTDQGDDITQTLKLASQGKLSTKKRQMARKLTNSPRKIISPRSIDADDHLSCHLDDATCACGSRTPYWPSQESRDLDYGCGDTTSVLECHDSFNDTEMFAKTGKSIERCMSCISKLGAPSMSRSSTATGNATPGGSQAPLWTILTEQNNQQNNCLSVKELCVNKELGSVGVGVDRMSICSSHGSSGGYGSSGGSEYSVPRMTTANITASSYADSCYEIIPQSTLSQCYTNNHFAYQNCNQHSNQNHNQNNSNNKKTSTKAKPPMPLPIVNPLLSHHHNQQQQQRICITTQPTTHVGPYENYDIPRTSLQVDSIGNTTQTTTSISTTIAAENYDTPKNIQEYLLEDLNSNSQMSVYGNGEPDKYGNYDTPAQMCGCLMGQSSIIDGDNSESCGLNSNNSTLKANKDNGSTSGNNSRTDCACNRVMSWADNWISIPYCRRGNGIENTSVPINRVKLNGEGKMPVMQPTGELAIYATVDFSKKTKRRTDQTEKLCHCSKDDDSETSSSNYINLDPGHVLQLIAASGAASNGAITSRKQCDLINTKTEFCSANYTNLDFAHSLENYENSKELLQKAGITLQEIEELRLRENQSFCQKCGHSSAKTLDPKSDKTTPTTDLSQSDGMLQPQQEYLKLDTDKSDTTAKFPGYLPMSPAPPNSNMQTSAINVLATANATIGSACNNGQAPPLPTKCELLKRIIGEKSASNPSLSGPVVDRSRKRNDPNRIPGSAMMLLHRTSSSPYNRKQLMNNSDLLPPIDKKLAARKRSSSADSSRFLEDPEEFDSSETLRKSSFTQINSERRSSSPCLHQEMEQCVVQICCNNNNTNKLSLSNETEDDSSLTSTSHSQNSQSVNIRRSASVPCKAQNRDSSSSNDSGVSTGSLRHRVGDFHEFELPLTTAMSTRRHQRHMQPISAFLPATLPRRSKSFDPLREISFQFQKVEIPGKSTSAEAEVPICPPKGRGFASPCGEGNTSGAPPYVDSRSTSSGTSDMSDYIETLSLSSHSSSDAPENLRLLRQATSTLRPRSGKEYHNIDRSLIALSQVGDITKIHQNPPAQLRGLLSCSTNYANITPVPENTESPSPGYQSGSSPQDLHQDSFVFNNQIQSKQ